MRADPRKLVDENGYVYEISHKTQAPTIWFALCSSEDNGDCPIRLELNENGYFVFGTHQTHPPAYPKFHKQYDYLPFSFDEDAVMEDAKDPANEMIEQFASF